jgi:hypothetical protein
LDLPPLFEKVLALVVDLDEFGMSPRLVFKVDGVVRPNFVVKVGRQRRVFSMHDGIDAGVHVSFDPFAVLKEQDALLLLALEFDRVVLRVIRVKIDRLDERADLHLVQALLQYFFCDVRPVFRTKVIDDHKVVVDNRVVVDDGVVGDDVFAVEGLFDKIDDGLMHDSRRLHGAYILMPRKIPSSAECTIAVWTIERAVVQRLYDAFPGDVGKIAWTRFFSL